MQNVIYVGLFLSRFFFKVDYNAKIKITMLLKLTPEILVCVLSRRGPQTGSGTVCRRSEWPHLG